MLTKTDLETRILLERLQSASFRLDDMRRQVTKISPLLDEQEQFHFFRAIARLEADSLSLASILRETDSSH